MSVMKSEYLGTMDLLDALDCWLDALRVVAELAEFCRTTEDAPGRGQGA